MNVKNGFKKTLASLLVVVMLLTSAPLSGIADLDFSGVASWFSTTAQAATEGYLTYRVYCSEAIITDCDTSISGSLSIPSTLGGYPVTAIDYEAFRGCTGLTSVTIPDSVTSINGRAFYKCTGLIRITIPDSVISIGSYAFEDCTGLTSITIPNSVTSIGSWAFWCCTGLTSITIPDSVTSIGSSAFHSCTGLTSVTISDSVTSIGDCAFEYCTGLTSITIPDSVTSIGDSAFSGCTGLTSVTIPNGVTSIGYSAFEDCTGLTNITIPDSVTSISWSTFRGCTSLTSITVSPGNMTYHSENNCIINTKRKELILGCKNSVIPSDGSVTSIGAFAFEDCTGLTSMTIPDSVTSIGSYAFAYCIGLTSVTIGNSVTSIENSAFWYCMGLKTVYYAGTKEQWESIFISYENDHLKNANIIFNSSGSGSSSGDTDPKDDTYDNYEDKEEIEKELNKVSVVAGNMDSYTLAVALNSDNSSYVSEVTVNGTVYHVTENVLSDEKAGRFKNKNVFIAIKDGKVGWIDTIDTYVGKPYIEISKPQYSYNATEGLKCISDKKDIVVKINYPFKNPNMAPPPGMSTSVFDTSAFYEMLSHEFVKCDLYDLSVSEVKVKSEDSNLKLSNSDIFVSTDKDTLKVCESIEYEIPTAISSSLTVSDDAANKKLSFYVEAKTSKGTLKKRGEVTVKNSNYRSNDKPWEHKPSSGGSQPDNDNQARRAGNILNNIPISLYGDISGSLYELFTKEQLESIAAVIYTEVAMYKAPKESFTDSLSTKIIEKVFKCKTNLLSFGQNEISLTFAVDTKWGEVKVEFTTKSDNLGLNGSNYAFYGTINYKIVGGKAEKKLPKSISKSGFAGGLSGVDMEAFCKAVWAVAQGQLKSSYNKAYGDDLNKAANIIFGESVNKVLKHTKYKSVSGLAWKLLVIPSTTIKIECPVDVFIYDSENKLVASFINDKMTSNSENVCLSIVDGTKTVQLFDDGYRVEYRPFAEGKMNITTEEYAFSGSLLNRTLIKDVPLSVGVTYKQQIDGTYIEDSDYSLVSNKGEKYDADEYSTVFHTHVSDGIIYHSDNSTCTLRGAEYKYCIICNEYYSDLLPLLEHIDKNSDGKCDHCGENLGTHNPSENCTCACHKKGIVKFFFKIGLFFQKLFKKNQICKCGVWHY